MIEYIEEVSLKREITLEMLNKLSTWFGLEDSINEYVANGGEIPENLQLIFSAWPGMPLDNPYNFPTSSPRFIDGSCAAPEGAKECPGNCSECAVMGAGCWTLKAGEGVVFNAH